MSNCVGNPLKPEYRLAAAGLLDKSLSCRTLRPRTVVRVLCSSPSSPASSFPNRRVSVKDVERKSASSVAEETQRIGSSRGRSLKMTTRVASLSSPVFPDEAAQDRYPKRNQNGAATSSRLPRVEVSAKGKWQKEHESSLSEDEPLPLPMTWPNSVPAPREKIDEILKCDPEKQVGYHGLSIFKQEGAQNLLLFNGEAQPPEMCWNTKSYQGWCIKSLELLQHLRLILFVTCKDVIYEWTGDCKRCQGTGLMSFYRKKHEVISKCINCLGIGSVHKITSRADIQDMDCLRGNSNGSTGSSNGSTGNSNGSVRGSPGTNGKA